MDPEKINKWFICKLANLDMLTEEWTYLDDLGPLVVGPTIDNADESDIKKTTTLQR